MPPAADVDTVAAVATSAGRSGIGIVRITGPRAELIAERLTGLRPKERVAQIAVFKDVEGQQIDSGIQLFFRRPKSYTGEDVLELHGHGNPILLAELVKRCCELGARVAEPGEFTKRAFLNGKLDLAQAEAVSSLIESQSLAAARGAMRSMAGEFSGVARGLGRQIISVRAQIEARLDFPEDELDLGEMRELVAEIRAIGRQVESLLVNARKGRMLVHGARVSLLGRPNVGKSSLMNRLARADVAIVTPIPGTTRDALRETIQLTGISILLSDTAGVRETEDLVERLGVERALGEAKAADLVLIVTDAAEGFSDGDLAIPQEIPDGVPYIWVANKIDLVRDRSQPEIPTAAPGVGVSAVTGEGIDTLEQEILKRLGCLEMDAGVFSARERHLIALTSVLSAVASAGQCNSLEIMAEELRAAGEALGELVGDVSSDELLGEIFSRFCIGK
jgi:tRNA modification GTPase